jgi:hypothetical protein
MFLGQLHYEEHSHSIWLVTLTGDRIAVHHEGNGWWNVFCNAKQFHRTQNKDEAIRKLIEKAREII